MYDGEKKGYYLVMFTSIEEIKQVVESNDSVITVSLEALRDAYGAGRTGPHVLKGISKELAGQGLAHYPQDLPTYQHQLVRIYKLGSPVADIIDAVLQVGDNNDELLRQAAASDETMLLRQIRELVCN